MRSSLGRSGIVREQWPLLALIGALALIWLGQELGPKDWDERLMVVPMHIARAWTHLRGGELATADLTDLGTLLSHAFLHGDFEHLLFNTLYLWIFAALLIRHLGKVWFVAIYILTAIAGGVAHTILNPGETIPMLGASGAVMGFEGAYLGLALRYRLRDPHIWPMAHPIPPAQLAMLATIGLIIDFYDVFSGAADFIAHGAHIGGFVMGFFICSFVRADEEPRT